MICKVNINVVLYVKMAEIGAFIHFVPGKRKYLDYFDRYPENANKNTHQSGICIFCFISKINFDLFSL